MGENKPWQKSNSFRESLGHAWHGLKFGWAAERNLKVQVVIFIGVWLLGLVLGLTADQLAIIALASGLVISLELVNTAIEEVSNVISDDFNHHLRRIKDIAAGAVLLASLMAILVGLFIFLPVII